MKPAVVFADPEAKVVALLNAAYQVRGVAATASVDYPATELGPNELRAQVDLELGDTKRYPVTEDAQVRVTCHAAPGRRSNVKSFASITQAILYTHPGDGDVAGIFIRTGRSDVTADPDTGNLMVWTLALVVLVAQPLTSEVL